MFIRTKHQEWELIKWLALLGLASALALTWATAWGADHRAHPVPRWHGSLANAPERFEPAVEPDWHQTVWKLLQLQQAHDYESVIDRWKEVPFPPHTQVWKWIALSQAHLALGRQEEASQMLAEAESVRPDHALVHYYRALLRLEQARWAEPWEDVRAPIGERWVAWPSGSSALDEVAPNTPDMYKLAARMELDRCLQVAADVWLDEPLLPAEWSTAAALEPTVRDLLLALAADRFAARAHYTLGALHLEQGSLAVAEEHLDQATQGGVSVPFAYQDLAREYEDQNRVQDALRANLKALQFGSQKLEPARRAWENVRRLFL
jgi:tetratricopeptide (TPR) repeat protein